MIRYILKRLVLMIPVLVGVIFIIFTINYISPGDPLVDILGIEASAEQRAAKAHELGLDQPYLVQLGNYIWGIFTRLDFGTSYRTNRPVRDEVLERFPTTLLLTSLITCLSVPCGLTFGILTAVFQNSILDYVVTFIALAGASMPQFWLALMLMLVFALTLGWFPAIGFDTPRHWVLPTIACGMLPISTLTRNVRSSMLEVIRQDYIRTARAKGLGELKIIFKHALRNALIPIITVIGFQVTSAMAGAIVAEQIFSIPGMGALLISSIKSKNYPSIQGNILWMGLMASIINLIVDLAYAYIDPRIKAQFTRRKAKATKKTAEAKAV